ncbi:serine/threonine protein kinase [Mucor velutinosus]|uniref:Serine/threonine protein kinase n=1 Tax=Mucor velutinosus TaxID=708070 RepID=A0AAN7D7N7_9FUNG|nr:serine/threonine protein kinase [Mucor velutinosus]
MGGINIKHADIKAKYLEIKDSCPAPELYSSSKPYSLIMETSQFDSLKLDSSGPSSLLSLLKNQFPEGVAITERSRSVVARRDRLQYCETKRYLEIAFDSKALLTQALSRPFEIKSQAIKFSKTLNKGNGEAYQLHISDVEQLGDPLKHRDVLLEVLNQHGMVECLHLHYTKDANWFTGEGCAIWIGKLNKSEQRLAFEDKLKACFSYSEYPLINADIARARNI